MFTKEIIKTLFKQAGIKIEIEEKAKGFIVETPQKRIYIWENEIVTKDFFDKKIVKFYQEKNQKTLDIK